MVWYTLHHVAWLMSHGYYDRAARLVSQLLNAERSHPGITSMIHRFMYTINPDWGI